MEFQRGQQLADALDLSSRLAQREATDKKESQLFNALCDQNRFKTGEEEKEKDRDDDWRQFLVSFYIKNYSPSRSLCHFQRAEKVAIKTVMAMKTVIWP